MSFIINCSADEILVKENKRIVFVVRKSASHRHLLFINTGYHTARRYTYLHSNHYYIDRVERSLIIKYTKIHSSGLIL